MSIKVTSWVFQHSEARGNERLVLIAIADEADDDGTNAFPGIDRIALKARLPKRTVMRCLSRLEENHHLVVVRPQRSGRGHHNTYTVVMPGEPIGAKVSPFESPDNPVKGAQGRASLPNLSQTHRPIDQNLKSKTLAVPAETIDLLTFDAFWAAYPLHKAKAAAKKAWASALRRATPEVIMAGLARYVAEQRQPGAPHTAYAASWLNADRWEDEPTPPRRVGRPSVADANVALGQELLRRTQ